MIYDILTNFLEQAQTGNLKTKKYIKQFKTLKVRVSFGQGTRAEIPWVAFLWGDQKVKKGIYPVFLYYKAQSKLLLCFGVSETEKPENIWPNNITLTYETVGQHFDEIPRYKASYIFKEYEVRDNMLTVDEEIIESDIDYVTNIYIETMKTIAKKITPVVDFTKNIIKLKKAIYNTKMSFSKLQVERLCLSLLTKPFLILTGNSGTGKTKITQLLAQWLNNYYTILPVGADWTDNRPILGYYNPLTKTYQSTPALDLILNATDEPERPFFLILDEMNLSHVERYFADLLSAMESGETVPLHNEEVEVNSSSGWMVPNNIAIPNNLFVIGTVNVDETTYMFSPKVLDRANVIEFKVGLSEFEQFLENGGSAIDEIEPAPVGSAEGFLALARDLRLGAASIEELPAGDMTTVKNCLKDLFGILAFTGNEFAYRTAGEIIRYIKLSRHMADEVDKWTPEVALDEQILQKVLPKLHGSRRQIEPLLKALAMYCFKPDSNKLSDINSYFESAGEFSVNLQTGDIAYPESFAKLKEMVNTVERDQFVSFIR